MPKKYGKGSMLYTLAENLLGANYSPKLKAANKLKLDYSVDDDGAFAGLANDISVKDKAVYDALVNDYTNIQNIEDGVTGSQVGKLALGAMGDHPFKTAGLIGLGAGNIGGLTDGNGIGGQIAGLGLGGLGAATLASGNPYVQAMMTLGGGELGALFDKLRAKKEQPQPQQYYGGR